jgi:hypothetical protein
MMPPNEMTGEAEAELLAEAANKRAPEPPRPAPLASVIAATTRALEGRWEDSDGTGSDRIQRFTALKELVEDVTEHCAGSRRDAETRVAAKYLAAVNAWAWGSANLVLLGETGAGKTTAAALLVRRLCAEGAHIGGVAFEKAQLIRFQSCRDLSQVHREMRLGDGTPEPIVRCQNARLLVLDDIGATDEKGALERILNVRYKRAWPTVTTSGLRYRELVVAFGEALVRRMTDCNGKPGRVLQVFPTPEAMAHAG